MGERGRDQLALGPDGGGLAEHAVALGAVQQHAQRGVDLVATHRAAALELAVEILEHGRRHLDLALALTLDEHLVAAGDDAHRQLLLDPGEIEVVLAEQDGAGGIVVEVHPVARAPEVGQRCERGQAGSSLSVIAMGAAAPARLCGLQRVISTGTRSPIARPSPSTWTACR